MLFVWLGYRTKKRWSTWKSWALISGTNAFNNFTHFNFCVVAFCRCVLVVLRRSSFCPPCGLFLFQFKRRRIPLCLAKIDCYAKKDSANQTGLIRSAWWQPFYRSKTITEGFASATQITVSDGKETALLLALPNQAPALVKAIQKLNSTWSVSPEAIWVNPAFHRYLQGGYK